MNTQTTHLCVAAFASIGVGASAGWYLTTGPSDEVNADRGAITSSGPSAETQPAKDGEAPSPPHVTESRQNPAGTTLRNAEPIAVAAERSNQFTYPAGSATEITPAKREQHRELAKKLNQFVRDDRQRLTAANRAVENMMDWWRKTKVDLTFAARNPDISRFLDDTGREISRLHFSTMQLSERRKAILERMESAAASVTRDPSAVNVAPMGQMVDEYKLLVQEHSQAGQEFSDYIERVLKTVEQLVNQ